MKNGRAIPRGGRAGLNPDPEITDIFIGSHSIGDFGHGSGPTMADFNPLRMTYTLSPTNLFAVEFFSFTVIPEWGPRKVTLPLEDDAVLTDAGSSGVSAQLSHSPHPLTCCRGTPCRIPACGLGAVGVLALAAWGAFGSTPEPRALAGAGPTPGATRGFAREPRNRLHQRAAVPRPRADRRHSRSAR